VLVAMAGAAVVPAHGTDHRSYVRSRLHALADQRDSPDHVHWLNHTVTRPNRKRTLLQALPRRHKRKIFVAEPHYVG
jgi:hypothetical protein